MVVVSSGKFVALSLQRLLQSLQIVAALLQEWVIDGDWRIKGIVRDLAGKDVLVCGEPLPKFLALRLKWRISLLAVLRLHRSIKVALPDMMDAGETYPRSVKLCLQKMYGTCEKQRLVFSINFKGKSQCDD